MKQLETDSDWLYLLLLNEPRKRLCLSLRNSIPSSILFLNPKEWLEANPSSGHISVLEPVLDKGMRLSWSILSQWLALPFR